MPAQPPPMPSPQSRLVSPAEALIDALDRASTCNFMCIASVRGGLTQGALTLALRALERRHPLLRARIARGRLRTKLVPGEAAPIPLRIQDGPEDSWRAIAESSLAHRTWHDAGPRAELTWLRHSRNHSTLLFCFQHIVSDGISGAIALRDLLSLVVERVDDVEPVPSPGTAGIRAKKAAGEPLLAASHLGPILTKSTAHLSRALFRRLVESQVYVGTFSLSNLGNLADFGVVADVGPLRVENVWSVSAGSVLHSMSAMALSFRGALNVQVCSVAPFIVPAVAARVLAAAERRLLEYASVATCQPTVVALQAQHTAV